MALLRSCGWFSVVGACGELPLSVLSHGLGGFRGSACRVHETASASLLVSLSDQSTSQNRDNGGSDKGDRLDTFQTRKILIQTYIRNWSKTVRAKGNNIVFYLPCDLLYATNKNYKDSPRNTSNN